MRRSIFVLLIGALASGPSAAHDTWVQTNTNLVRTGDAIYVDLMLGNHGNDHRDFKLASKLPPDAPGTFEVVTADGKRYDLLPGLTDVGYAPNEGFYSAKFVTAVPGIYTVAQASDRIVKHGKPVRTLRSSKTFFLVSNSLDKVAAGQAGFERALGHPLELVPETNPVAPMGPGVAIKVRLLFEGKPLAGAKVSFIPRGVVLKEGTDTLYERVTGPDGRAAFTPRTGNYYLVVAHWKLETAGQGYESTNYSATLTVLVPEKCPCCGE